MDPFSFYYPILKRYVYLPALTGLWDDPKRKFHNIDHLKDVLAYIEKHKDKISTYDRYVAIILAAFFHDAWYDPKDKFNEDKSIDLLKRSFQYFVKTKETTQYFEIEKPKETKSFLEPTLTKLKKIFKLKKKDKDNLVYNDPAILNEAIKLIEVTKYRKVPIEKLSKLFWMADNEILTKDFNALKNYETKIKQEYSSIPESIYKVERIKFLKTNIGLFDKKIDENLLKLIKYCEDIYKK